MSRDRAKVDPSRVRRVLRMKAKYGAGASSPARSTSRAKSDAAFMSVDLRDRSLAGETFRNTRPNGLLISERRIRYMTDTAIMNPKKAYAVLTIYQLNESRACEVDPSRVRRVLRMKTK